MPLSRNVVQLIGVRGRVDRAARVCQQKPGEIARPPLEQLAIALRSPEPIQPRGVALTRLLLTDPCSAVYAPAYSDQLYDIAREALLEVGLDQAGAGRYVSLRLPPGFGVARSSSSPW